MGRRSGARPRSSRGPTTALKEFVWHRQTIKKEVEQDVSDVTEPAAACSARCCRSHPGPAHLQSLGSFKGDALFFTWLYRIAANIAVSLRRKNRVLARIDNRNGDAALERPEPLEMSRPGHALEQAEEGQKLHRALARLSAEHRAVLVMKELQEQKYEEMAEALRLPIGTIRSRLHRARLELRELLEQEEH